MSQPTLPLKWGLLGVGGYVGATSVILSASRPGDAAATAGGCGSAHNPDCYTHGWARRFIATVD